MRVFLDPIQHSCQANQGQHRKESSGPCCPQRLLAGIYMEESWAAGKFCKGANSYHSTNPWEGNECLPLSRRVTGTTSNGETLQNSLGKSKIPRLGAFPQGKEKETPNGDSQSMKILEDSSLDQERELSLLPRPGKEKESLASTCRLVLPKHQWEAPLIYPLKSRAAKLTPAKKKVEYSHLNQQWVPLMKQLPKCLVKMEGVGSE